MNLRELAVRFFKLKLSEKTDIAIKLGLLETQDGSMSDLDRFKLVLAKGKAEGKLDAIAREVELVERNKS